MIAITNGWDVAHLVIHSAFDELKKASEFVKISINIEEIEPMKSQSIGFEILNRQINSKEYLVKAVALFQAGMESLINYWQSKYPEIKCDSGFVPKYEKAFSVKGVSHSFDDYASFYRTVRNAIIHPDSQQKIETINNINFIQVYKGINHGWDALERLADKLGEPFDTNSWETLCNIHRVDSQLLESDYPDLKELSNQLYDRFKSHYTNQNR